MYCANFKRNTYLYLILKRTRNSFYSLEECVYSFDTSYKFICMYGNSQHLILKIKLKDIIHHY